ncbi:hypothetical protein LOTGIDRAFT_160041 [Lottia gigantea]|uniref:Uncharacterized protein n=1 Tax=Lottia gigantea TaxID=225164 RepID=V3ZX06_LOTGI|nr:hypothetical protein LOTGIDRAFT_160041 [Lottia gigantea]ESO96058.1 hypothetical protein LOTGIDRAFT_160041 [Lottia gigantea]
MTSCGHVINTTFRNGFCSEVLTSVDIQEIVKAGGRIIRILDSIVYEENFKTPPYGDYILILRDLRNKYIREAAGAATGRISAAVKAADVKKAADAKAAEERRHNLIMEKEAKGSGVGDMIGTIKEFGKRFGEETKKTVKLVDSIDTGEVKVKHKGNGIFLKNIHTGEGLFLSKYKGEGVIFGIK